MLEITIIVATVMSTMLISTRIRGVRWAAVIVLVDMGVMVGLQISVHLVVEPFTRIVARVVYIMLCIVVEVGLWDDMGTIPPNCPPVMFVILFMTKLAVSFMTKFTVLFVTKIAVSFMTKFVIPFVSFRDWTGSLCYILRLPSEVVMLVKRVDIKVL